MSSSDYYISICASIFSHDNNGKDIQSNRKAIVVEIFITYLIYVVIIARGVARKEYPGIFFILNINNLHLKKKKINISFLIIKLFTKLSNNNKINRRIIQA